MNLRLQCDQAGEDRDSERAFAPDVHDDSVALSGRRYPIHMKRTNLVLDEHLLSEATRVLAAKTYSATVNTALEEVIRLRKLYSTPRFFGSGIWQGDLAEMREDRPRRPRRSR